MIIKNVIIDHNNSKNDLPAMRGMRASGAKPFEPSGPFGARIVVKRGADSSIELIFMREIRRSGRGEES
jgi:hypothetical protein